MFLEVLSFLIEHLAGSDSFELDGIGKFVDERGFVVGVLELVGAGEEPDLCDELAEE